MVGTGSVFGGFGPYTLSYPFYDWSDTITPDGTAEAAFMGNYGNAAVNKSNGTYKTTFWAFPFEALPSLSARNETMEAFLGWCGTISPQAPTLSAPQGDIDELRPEYTWNKVDTATSYDLLVKDANGVTVINQTYAADETNCPSSGSVCSVTPAVSLYCTSSYTWQVSANNIYGTRTSLEQNFKVAGFYVYERQSEYTWDKVDTAISYDLLVKDADEVSVINQSYAADETNCPASGSVCAVTPAVTLDYASYTLQVSARDASGVIGSIEQCFSVRYLTYIAFIYK